MSAEKHLDERDVQSTLRHTIYPAVASALLTGLVAALEALELELTGMLTAQATLSGGLTAAVIAGGLRLWKRYRMKS